MSGPRKVNFSCPSGLEACPVAVEASRLSAECERLSKISQVDSLTGLFNYHHLMHALQMELERTRRSGLPTGLIMIDMDHFKSINDSYGHQAGNDALRWVSGIMRDNIRLIDIPCRYGGEEFTLILPGTTLAHSVRTAERLRETLEKTPITLNGYSTRITASFGVDVYRGRLEVTPGAFLERADQHLLQAKARGRNCVCYEESDTSSSITEITLDERAALFITRWPK